MVRWARGEYGRSLTIIVIGLVFSILSLVFGAFDPLFDWLGTGTCNTAQLTQACQLRQGIAIGLSVFFALAGFLVAVFDKLAEVSSKVERHIGDLPLRVRNFRTFDNSNQALTYIAGRLSLASVVRNTRIVAHNLTRPEDFAGQERENYEDGVRKLIERGAFVYDVVTKHWESDAIKLAKLKNAKSYRCRVLRQDLPPCLNFTILFFGPGDRELIFGWALSAAAGFERQCFLTTDDHVIDFFEKWHEDLYTHGTNPEPAPAP